MFATSFETVIYTIYFILPGFIIAKIMAGNTPSEEKSEGEKVLTYLGYSVLNFALWFALYYLVSIRLPDKTPGYWLWLAIITLGGSVLTGFVLNILKQKEIVQKLTSNIALTTKNSIPTAWDYTFSTLIEGCYIKVCLDDGTLIRGAFYDESLASSDIKDRDLYIEKVYLLDENNKWVPDKNNEGIWISSKGIKWISFQKKKGE